MNRKLSALHGAQHHHLQHVGRAVGAEHELSVGVLADVLDDKRMVDGPEPVVIAFCC